MTLLFYCYLSFFNIKLASEIFYIYSGCWLCSAVKHCIENRNIEYNIWTLWTLLHIATTAKTAPLFIDILHLSFVVILLNVLLVVISLLNLLTVFMYPSLYTKANSWSVWTYLAIILIYFAQELCITDCFNAVTDLHLLWLFPDINEWTVLPLINHMLHLLYLNHSSYNALYRPHPAVCKCTWKY